MQSSEIRTKFLKFFESKGHKVVPSASLVPEGDSSVLFTIAGMQQFKPYYIGAKDPIVDFGTKDTVSIQKSMRTSDIEEVGDERHLTFFEMLGNFSFGGYWKEEAIKYAHEFVTKEMGLNIDYVTVFEGEEGVPEDKESEAIWKSINPDIVVKKFGRADNFWGPTGEEGPCGPTTEIYVKGIEIWNIVFNEFYSAKGGPASLGQNILTPLATKGIDTGMGLERLAMVSQDVATVFETDLFPTHPKTREERIVADHLRAINALLEEGLKPGNKDQGYILRRLMRRVLLFKNKFNLDVPVESEIFKQEEAKFNEALEVGEKRLKAGEDPFILYTSYGFPLEMIKELGIEVDEKDFQEKFKQHQELSRAGSDQKFKGGLAGHSDMEVKYHTATHLLHLALHDVLGDDVGQKGSNITPERLRFDFSFPRKMTDEEKRRVEEIVNEKIGAGLPVQHRVLHREEAVETGARHFFDQKYPDEVSVYYIGDSLESAYSKEFCGGPHVENTNVLASTGSAQVAKFKIVKEEAISAGVRRIKAVLG